MDHTRAPSARGDAVNGETAPTFRSHLIPQQSGLPKANLLHMYNKGLSRASRPPIDMVNFPEVTLVPGRAGQNAAGLRLMRSGPGSRVGFSADHGRGRTKA
jgi:hypothetical protein